MGVKYSEDQGLGRGEGCSQVLLNLLCHPLPEWLRKCSEWQKVSLYKQGICQAPSRPPLLLWQKKELTMAGTYYSRWQQETMRYTELTKRGKPDSLPFPQTFPPAYLCFCGPQRELDLLRIWKLLTGELPSCKGKPSCCVLSFIELTRFWELRDSCFRPSLRWPVTFCSLLRPLRKCILHPRQQHGNNTPGSAALQLKSL